MFVRVYQLDPGNDSDSQNCIGSEELMNLSKELRTLFAACTEWVNGEPTVIDVDTWCLRLKEIKDKYGRYWTAIIYNNLSKMEGIELIRESLEVTNKNPLIKVTGDNEVKLTIINQLGGREISNWGRTLRLRPNEQGSGGHGYDISTNGRGRRKVVTGKAGNQYPIPKKKW